MTDTSVFPPEAFPAIPPAGFPPAGVYVAPPTFEDGEPAEHQPITLEAETHTQVVSEGDDPVAEEPGAPADELTDVGELTDVDD